MSLGDPERVPGSQLPAALLAKRTNQILAESAEERAFRVAKAQARRAAVGLLEDSERLRRRWLIYFEQVSRYMDALVPWAKRAKISLVRYSQLMEGANLMPPGCARLGVGRGAWLYDRWIRPYPALVRLLGRRWLGRGPTPPTVRNCALASMAADQAGLKARVRAEGVMAGLSPLDAEARAELALEEWLAAEIARLERASPKPRRPATSEWHDGPPLEEEVSRRMRANDYIKGLSRPRPPPRRRRRVQ